MHKVITPTIPKLLTRTHFFIFQTQLTSISSETENKRLKYIFHSPPVGAPRTNNMSGLSWIITCGLAADVVWPVCRSQQQKNMFCLCRCSPARNTPAQTQTASWSGEEPNVWFWGVIPAREQRPHILRATFMDTPVRDRCLFGKS